VCQPHTQDGDEACTLAHVSHSLVMSLTVPGFNHSLTVHSTPSYMKAIVRYSTDTMGNLGNFTTKTLVLYSTLSYRTAIVRVLWSTIAQNTGTVRLITPVDAWLPTLIATQLSMW
jgi:hypothetical protein